MYKTAVERADIGQRIMSLAQARMMAIRNAMITDPTDDEWARISQAAREWAKRNTDSQGNLRAGVDVNAGLEEWTNG